MAYALDIHTLMSEMESLIKAGQARLTASPPEDGYVGTAADGLVTAILREGRLTVDLHILAKRRLERDELADAIIQAVHAAEAQASGALTEFLEAGLPAAGAGSDFRAQVAETVRRIQRQLPI